MIRRPRSLSRWGSLHACELSAGQGARLHDVEVDADGGKDVLVGRDLVLAAAHEQLQVVDEIRCKQNGRHHRNQEVEPPACARASRDPCSDARDAPFQTAGRVDRTMNSDTSGAVAPVACHASSHARSGRRVHGRSAWQAHLLRQKIAMTLMTMTPKRIAVRKPPAPVRSSFVNLATKKAPHTVAAVTASAMPTVSTL